MQTRLHSLIETLTSVFIGFLIGLLANLTVLPAFGYAVTVADSIGISVVFTLIGVARGYLFRRLFNKIDLKKYIKEV